MKFVYPDIDHVFDTECGLVNVIVIEHPGLLYELLSDIKMQLSGDGGRTVVSQDASILPFAKHIEFLDQFVPFYMNTRSLMSKVAQDLENRALQPEKYAETIELVGTIDSYIGSLTFDYPCSLDATKLNIGAILKASGIVITDDYGSLGEKLIDYFLLVNELLGRKLFITYNLRCILSDAEANTFLETVLSHGLDAIMIESFDRPRLEGEKRLIVDKDFCLIE